MDWTANLAVKVYCMAGMDLRFHDPQNSGSRGRGLCDTEPKAGKPTVIHRFLQIPHVLVSSFPSLPKNNNRERVKGNVDVISTVEKNGAPTTAVRCLTGDSASGHHFVFELQQRS